MKPRDLTWMATLVASIYHNQKLVKNHAIQSFWREFSWFTDGLLYKQLLPQWPKHFRQLLFPPDLHSFGLSQGHLPPRLNWQRLAWNVALMTPAQQSWRWHSCVIWTGYCGGILVRPPCQAIYVPSAYDIHSLPWKDPPIFKNGKPSISMGHGFHGYVT